MSARGGEVPRPALHLRRAGPADREGIWRVHTAAM